MISAGSGRRILVVDDHDMVLTGLRALLTREGWVGRCLTARCGAEAFDLCRRYEPHVAVVDLFIGDELGLDVSRKLLAEQPSLKIILTSGTGSVTPAVARAAGAHGFVPKHWPAQTVVDAIHRVCLGSTVFPRADVEPANKLSKRERDVLNHIVQGLSNPEVAEVLHLSRHTVKQHTMAVYRKLGARNRAEAASIARQYGLVA
jgi:two-component system response regulator DesR